MQNQQTTFTLYTVATEAECAELWSITTVQPEIYFLNGFACEITNGMLKIMANQLHSCFPNIETLDLRNNLLTNYCFEFLELLLHSNPNINTLVLLDNHISAEQMAFEMSDEYLMKCIFIPWKLLKDKETAIQAFGKENVAIHLKFFANQGKTLLLPSQLQ